MSKYLALNYKSIGDKRLKGNKLQKREEQEEKIKKHNFMHASTTTFMVVLYEGMQSILFLWSVISVLVKFNSFALILLYVTQCMIWRLNMAYVNCKVSGNLF